MKVSDAIVKILEQKGVDCVFALPGEENLDLIESLRGSNVKVIVTRHESAAGFMAATYGRLSGKVGVCITTLGPGATNAATPISYAYLGGMPCLFISGQKPLSDNDQGYFQKLDIPKMFDPISKKSVRIESSDSVVSTFNNFFKLALSDKQGPVHIELPEDIARDEVDPQELKDCSLSAKRSTQNCASKESISKLVEKIKASKKPLLVFGLRSKTGEACSAARKLVSETGLYAVTTQMGKGVIDEKSVHALGTAAVSENDYVHDFVSESDLIIMVGHDSVEKPPFLMSKSSSVELIHLDSLPAALHRVYLPKLEVIGSIAQSLDALRNELKANQSDFQNTYADERKKIEREIHSKSLREMPQASIERIVSEMHEALEKDSILTLDNGLYKVWFSRNYPSVNPDSVVLDNALATMGAGLPSGMCAKILNPDKHVVAVCGDGGFLMNSQELETAKRLKLDLTVVVLVDDAYGMIKWKQDNMDLEDFAMDFENPDFQKLSEAYGAKAFKVSAEKSLGDCLSGARQTKGVSLIEVPLNYYTEHKTLPDKLQNSYK